jgi:hypothetical protein
LIDEKKLDDKIARLVRSVELEVPPGVDAEIREAAEHLKPAPRLFKMRRPLWLALIPSAAAALLAVIALLPTPQKPLSPISEIRTEFEIADKNIKIIFIQKPDFNLFKEN